MELKELAYGTLIVVGIIALSFSLYTNYQFAKSDASFLKDYEQFKEDWVSGAYDLKIIRGDPQVFENFYDSCNEKEIQEVLESIQGSLSNMEITIEEFQTDFYQSQLVQEEVPEGITFQGAA